MTDEDHAFVRVVWEEFLMRRPVARMMSPTEHSLARHWAVNGYPLRVVLRAIRETTRCGGSLMYFQEPVEAAMRRHESPM